MTRVLDACCGSRMFWFDKENKDVVFMDKRKEYEELSTGHVINVNPGVIGDFRNMPFKDETFIMLCLIHHIYCTLAKIVGWPKSTGS